MNKVFSIVWNHTLQAWIVASEKAARRGKRSNGKKRAIGAIATGLLSTVVQAAPPATNALPTNGQVIAGQVGISQSSNTMNINQSTQQGIINWQSFNIGSDATVNFVQPNSQAATLNRVTSGGASQIFGNLNANGQVFVVNPNGVLFGKSAQVDVGGLVASTLAISNEDFMAGNYQFSGNGSEGSVVNQGELLGRYVAMLAPEVRNEGVVLARLGSVAMAAGESITLSITGDSLIDVQVSKAQFDTLVENRHLVEAQEGLVVLSAQSAAGLLGQTVNTGAISAGGIVNDGGTVRLVASSDVEHTGSINVDGGQNGDGGESILLASLENPASRTDISGSISARGGVESGNGGFIETSANRVTIADSASINTSAPHGSTGEWLIDPTDFTIGVGGDIDGTTLETQLASSNVTIESVNGASGANGDIFVNESLVWAANQLTLTADRNIEINAELTVTGGGGLNLEFGQSGSAGDFFNMANYFVSAPVNLASGTTFTTTFGNDGVTDNYTVITDEAGLLAVDSNMTGNYVLGSDISVSSNPWNPLGNATGDFAFGTTGFTGIFDGLGHTIDGLTRGNTANSTGIGLFGQIGDSDPFGVPGGLVQNLGLTNVNLAGLSRVGALAGASYGIVSNVYSTGTITGGDAVGSTTDDIVGSVGGLVGNNAGLIGGSYSSANVTATTGDQSFGEGSDGGTGGLVGSNFGSIDSSYATGSVAGDRDVGGLVGYVDGTVYGSYSSGLVTGTTNVGGLVGAVLTLPPDPFGPPPPVPVESSYWNTTTSGVGTSAGGGTGLTDTQAQQQASYAGFDFANTWVIYEGTSQPLLRSMLTPYYVTVDDQSKTYDGTAFSGFTATESDSTRPAEITGTLSYSGTGTTAADAGSYTVSVTGLNLTDAGKQNQQGYIIEYVDGTATIDQAALTVSASNQSKTYGDSLALDASAFSITGLVAGETVGSVSLGSVSGNDANTSVDAGTYNGDLQVSNATGGTFNAANYSISYVGADLIVDQRAITVTAGNQSKTYGDSLALDSLAFSVANLANGELIDSVTLISATGIDADTTADAGIYADEILATGVSGSNGFNAANYDITYLSADLTVDQRAITVAAANQSKAYGDALTLDTTGFTATNLANAELITAVTLNSATGIDADTTADAAIYADEIVASGVLGANGFSEANYDITYQAGDLEVRQREVSVTLGNQSKTYGDALTLDNTAFIATNLVNGNQIDTVNVASLAGADTDTTANVATYSGDIVGSGVTGSGGFNSSNYAISYVAGDLTVDPRAITVTAGNQSKTYGDNLDLGNSAFTATNLANGETIGSVTLTSANATNTGAGADVYLNDIAASNASGGSFNAANYSITYQSGDLTVDKATLTVRADDKSINEGDNLPAFTQTISGFVNGETLETSDLSGSGEATTTAVDGGPSGNYVITSEQATLASGNYTFDLVDGTLTIAVTTPSTPSPASGSGTEEAVEIVQKTLNKEAQGNGGSAGATSSAGGSLDDVAGTGSNGGTAPGSEAEAIQQGANQFCNNCVDTKNAKSADEVMVDYMAAVGKGTLLLWTNEADLTDAQKVERKQAEKNADSYQKFGAEFTKKFPGGQTISALTQVVEYQFEADKAAEQAKIANKSLKNAQADELVARQKVTASENKLRDAETALAANPDSQENKMAVLNAKLQVNVDKSQYRKTKMAVADAQADAELKAAEVQTVQSKISRAKAQTLAAMAEEREAEAAALMADALAAPEKAKKANELYKSANEESAKKSEELNQSKLIVESTKAEVVKAKEDVKKAKEKAPTAKFVAVVAAFGAAKAKNESDAAAARADPNGVYIKTYAKRAAILAQLHSLNRLIGDVVRGQAMSNITGAHNDTAKNLLDQTRGALKNERSTDVAALQRILDSVKSNAPNAFAKRSEHEKYLAGGGQDGVHGDYKYYLDSSFHLMTGLKEAALSKIGSDAAGQAAKDSAKIAASLAEEAKQAAQKSGEASASALKLAAEAEAAAASAAADIAEAENRQAVAEKAQKEAEEKARKRAEENAAAIAAKQKAWEDKVRAENAAKAVKMAALKKMHEDRKAKSDAANQVVNKSEAQLKAEEKARKENALVNAKNELALYVKGAKEAADTAAEAKAAVEEAKTSIANSKAEKIKWETIAAEKAAQIPVTAKAAEVDAKAAKVAMDTFNASEEAAKKAGEDFDALNQIQFNAEKELAIAKRERKSLDVTLKAGNSLELLSTIIQLSTKDQAKIDAADAKVAAAEKKYKELKKNAEDKLKQYNALSKKATADADAANAAAAKAAQSDLLARQTKADKEVAEQNIVIASDNAKNMAVYLKDAEEYAASTEARSKLVSPEVQVRRDRVAKAEAALKELEAT